MSEISARASRRALTCGSCTRTGLRTGPGVPGMVVRGLGTVMAGTGAVAPWGGGGSGAGGIGGMDGIGGAAGLATGGAGGGGGGGGGGAAATGAGGGGGGGG